jgi:anti-sigma-K factor RskA
VQRWWQRLGVWQGATGLATAFAVVMAVLLAQPAPLPPAQPPIVVVMAPQDAAATAGIQPAGFVASLSGDGRSLVLKPLDAHQRVAVNKALELWAVPAHGAPRSLGLVSDQHATTVLRTRLLQDTAAFAVSVEPPGGSPSGAPTGPIVSVGKLQL